MVPCASPCHPNHLISLGPSYLSGMRLQGPESLHIYMAEEFSQENRPSADSRVHIWGISVSSSASLSKLCELSVLTLFI